jgi:DNA-directed RNA polymerase subunit M/transcription elongation factor TFIIS
MFETVEKIELNPKPVIDAPQESFCPRCGSFLKVEAKKGHPLLSCLKCGYNKPIGQNQVPKQNIRLRHPSEIAVIDKKEEAALRTFPTVNVQCPVCGKNESETWTVAVGGETANSTVTFFRCTTCGHTRRETG